MVWVRIDDHFDEHPKIAALDDHAVAVLVSGLAYCNRNLTDGFIPKLVGKALRGGGAAGIKSLECIGLWEAVEGGWQVHDFEDYQPTRQQVEEERAKKQAAGQAGGKASAQARASAHAPPRAKANGAAHVSAGAQPNAEAHAQAKSKPGPGPGPVGTVSGEESLNAAAAAAAASARDREPAREEVKPLNELLAELPEEMRERLSKAPIGTGRQQQPRRLNDILNGREHDVES